MKDFLTDVLVIGGGAAGVRAALEASKYKVDVILVTLGRLGRSGSTPMSGGVFAAALDTEDNVQSHIKDTIVGGLHLNDEFLAKILADLKRGKTVLINTFDMSEYYQGLFVKLLLRRLQKAGKHALHKNIAQRILVVIDEAQHFVRTVGDSIAEFVMECRKFGITLLLSPQSPKSIPERVAGQIYSIISFHLNKADLKVLVELAPTLDECRSMIAHPTLKQTLGLAIVQAAGYPYPAVIKVPRFERRIEQTKQMLN